MKVKIMTLVVLSLVAVSAALAQNNQGVQGGGTPNYITKFTSKNTVGNSGLVENSSGLVTDESLTVGNFTAIVSTHRSMAVQGLHTTPDGDTADGFTHAIGLFGETSSPTSAAVAGIGNTHQAAHQPTVFAQAASLGLSTPSATHLVLYDNFRSTRIDPSKWVGEPASLFPGSDKDRREVSVGLVGEEEARRLRISQTNYSAITDNNGSSGLGFGLGFAQPSQLKAVSFTLEIDQVQVVDCGSNQTFVTAGFFGDYFNPTGATNGQTGDIVVSIAETSFNTSTGTVIDVGASVSQCQDAQCNGQTVLLFQDLGLVPKGSTNTLAAAWDQLNHQFIFRLNNDSPVSLAYTVPDSFPPGSADKSFFVAGTVPHCTATPRPLASMDSLFGNVYVNP